MAPSIASDATTFSDPLSPISLLSLLLGSSLFYYNHYCHYCLYLTTVFCRWDTYNLLLYYMITVAEHCRHVCSFIFSLLHGQHCESGGSNLVSAQQRMLVWERNPQVPKLPRNFSGQCSNLQKSAHAYSTLDEIFWSSRGIWSQSIYLQSPLFQNRGEVL